MMAWLEKILAPFEHAFVHSVRAEIERAVADNPIILTFIVVVAIGVVIYLFWTGRFARKK